MLFPIWPDEAASGAQEVDQIVIGLVLMSLFFIIVVAGPILYFGFKYRRSRPANRVISHHNTWAIEITWTLVPLIIAVCFFVVAASVYFRQRHPPADAMEIHVIGKQWMWKIQHPQGKREINELHVPVGVPIKLLMTSQDVIHSFYIPAFRIKQDVLPGRYTSMWFVPQKTGEYHLFCTQYCGEGHARMTGKAIVLSKADYQKWLTSGEQSENPAKAGAELFRQYGCSGCHAGSRVVRAPSLVGLYGSVVPLEGNKTTIADDQYLRDSILLPNSQVVAGYEPVMPSYQGKLSEDALFSLIAYLKSLGPGAEEGGTQPLKYSNDMGAAQLLPSGSKGSAK
ncbi:MAG: cytochrome c oxidase subunit II [Verrucomicrobia bacterium]|nr:cytochrome c oxidase subunit II [Verrucomicrobiota bacterium]